MLDIARILGEEGRDWTASPPATESTLQALVQSAPEGLPAEYLDLLRYSDGGEGSLALEPLYFMLYSADHAAALNKDEEHRELYSGYFAFGSNGGLESIAFDVRQGQPWPIVMVDPVAGTESAEIIAPSMADFVMAIGLDSPED